MESKHSAEEILKEQGIEFCFRDFTEGIIRKADILSVLAEVASIAWDASFEYTMQRVEKLERGKPDVTAPDKETFLKQLLKGE